MSRAETGPMKFGDDWTGVFIRGDNSGYYAMLLDQALEELAKTDYSPIYATVLRGFVADLGGSREGASEPQRMRPFEECVRADLTHDEAELVALSGAKP